MSNSTSLLAYPDIKNALDKALESTNGVRISFKTVEAAHRFLGRCNSFRQLDRRENVKIYPEPAMTLHGRSVYDVLLIKRDKVFVTIIPIKPEDIELEIL